MIMLAFFGWWYGRGWKLTITAFERRLLGISRAFSVSLLLRTLFVPWRRIITPPGSSLADKFHALGDNLVSRVIGFVVRFFVLLGALVSALVVGILSLVETLVWPLLPPAVPILLVIGLAR